MVPEAYRVTPFDKRGDDHLKQGLVVGHVEVRQDQSRTKRQFDALQGVRHVRLKGLRTMWVKSTFAWGKFSALERHQSPSYEQCAMAVHP